MSIEERLRLAEQRVARANERMAKLKVRAARASRDERTRALVILGAGCELAGREDPAMFARALARVTAEDRVVVARVFPLADDSAVPPVRS